LKIVGLPLIEEFAGRYPETKGWLETWVAFVKAASWSKPTDIRQMSNSASFLGGRRVIFNMKGNHFRMAVKVDYARQVVRVERIGTHAEYDKWTFED